MWNKYVSAAPRQDKDCNPPTPLLLPPAPAPLPRLKILQATHTCLLGSAWAKLVHGISLCNSTHCDRRGAPAGPWQGQSRWWQCEKLQGGLRSGSGPSVHVVAGSYTKYRQSPWPGHVCLAWRHKFCWSSRFGVFWTRLHPSCFALIYYYLVL